MGWFEDYLFCLVVELAWIGSFCKFVVNCNVNIVMNNRFEENYDLLFEWEMIENGLWNLNLKMVCCYLNV